MFAAHHRQHHFGFYSLLITLIILVLIAPYLQRTEMGEWLFGFLTILTLVTSIYVMRKKRSHMLISLGIAFASVVLNILALSLHFPLLTILVSCGYVLFYFFTTIILLGVVLTTPKVNHYTICGTICVYFLIGLTFANIYEVLEIINPGSLRLNAVPLAQALQITDFEYFSFVTLTTVGFGDITATTPEMRSIVVLESMTGVLYLAILIARMMGAMPHYNHLHPKE